MTVIKGLDQFDIKLNDAAKLFSKKFATSAAIKSDKGANDKGILMQGDVSDEVSEYILEKWGVCLKSCSFFFSKFPNNLRRTKSKKKTCIFWWMERRLSLIAMS